MTNSLTIGSNTASAVRTLASLGAWVLIVTLLFAAPLRAQDDEDDALPNPLLSDNPVADYFRESTSLRDWVAGLKSYRRPNDPPPPQLPKKFYWTGRYVVADLVDPRTGKLGITVPFVWWGENGNTQMIAGWVGDPIFFTNFIYNNKLYTYTFAWPQLQRRFLPPRALLVPVGDFSMEDLNAFFATSRYVGKTILQDKDYRYTHHFRATVVAPTRPPGARIRFALAQADIFVQQGDSTKFRQILHFGYHNLYDPELDEWIIIDKFQKGGGEFVFPPNTITLP
jgi:hypothetical protein